MPGRLPVASTTWVASSRRPSCSSTQPSPTLVARATTTGAATVSLSAETYSVKDPHGIDVVLNADPYGAGWLVEISVPGEGGDPIGALLDADAYQALVDGS